jgi:hypothetical protein
VKKTMRGNTTSAIIFLFICAWNVSKAHIEYEVRPIRGVSKKLWSQYQENIFKCILNGVEKLLTFERINDDYCDCDNGTDEPGTGACSHLINSEFFCENGGFFPKKVSEKSYIYLSDLAFIKYSSYFRFTLLE